MKLIIKSKPEHFYRAKMKFTHQPIEIDVTPDIAKILMNEPMLVVAEFINPPEQEDIAETPKAKVDAVPEVKDVLPDAEIPKRTPKPSAKSKKAVNTGRKAKK